MDDVHDVLPGLSAGRAVSFEEGGDVFACGAYVDGFQLSGCVFVLGVDDYEGAVGGGGSAGVDAYEVSEAGGGAHFVGGVTVWEVLEL